MQQLEKKLGEPIEKLLEKLYIEEEKSGKEIAEELELKEPTVYNFLKWFKIPRRDLSNAHKGRKLSKTHKEHIKHSLKGRKILWGDKISKVSKGKKKSEEHRKRTSTGLKKYYKTHDPWNKGKDLPPLTEEHKQKLSQSLKDRKVSKKTKRKISATNKGRSFSPLTEFKKNHRVPRDWREKFSKIHNKCKLNKEELYNLYWAKELSSSKLAPRFCVTPSTIRNWMVKLGIPLRTKSEVVCLMWENPEYQEKVFKGIKHRPSGGEKKLMKIIKDNNLLFEYCGDGKTFINRRCPDFIIYGERKLLEFFGDYWHSPEEEEERKRFFRKYNFETLVIWEHELRNEDDVLKKINAFIGHEEPVNARAPLTYSRS